MNIYIHLEQINGSICIQGLCYITRTSTIKKFVRSIHLSFIYYYK